MAPKQPPGPIRRFFAGLTEHVFHTRLGVADPPLVDYISELLARFIHHDELFRLRTPTGRRIDQVVDMLVEAQARQGTARREVHRHIGDYTLFWSGLFPEAVERMRRLGQKDSLIDYRLQGKKAYHIASTIPADRADAEADVLGRLSREFELCACGLTELRQEWSRRDDGPGELLPLWIN